MSWSGGEAYLEPHLLPVCCVCGLVRDDEAQAAPPRRVSWMTLEQYQTTYVTHPAPFLFTHTYCPVCLAKIRAAGRLCP